MTVDQDLQVIVDAFRTEAHELLQEIGENVLLLESTSEQSQFVELANKATRLAHNIKGAASTVDFGRVETLVHGLEDLLVAIREQQLKPTGKVVDTIFAALDLIDGTVSSSQQGDIELTAKEEVLLANIKAVLEQARGEQLSQDTLQTAEQNESSAASGEREQGGGEASAAQVETAAPETQFVRISQRKLDVLLDHLSDLVEMKIRLEETRLRVGEVAEELRVVDQTQVNMQRQFLLQLSRGIEHDIQYLNKVLGGIQEELYEIRMVPIGTLFPLLRRSVRDVSRKRDIKVELVLEGADYQIDRKIVEELKSPLIHLLRNAVDHGLESVAQREKVGKAAAGKVSFTAHRRGNSIEMVIADDGMGLDYRQIAERGVQLGLLKKSVSDYTDRELARLLFVPGFSTAKTTDSISGRGVGLDITKQVVEHLKGTIKVRSKQGEGTVFTMNVPLSMAAETGLFVVVGSEKYVIPQSAVARAIFFRSGDVVTDQGHSSLWFENRHIPLARLGSSLRLLQYQPDKQEGKQIALIVRSAEAEAAVVVDDIAEETEIVIRNLGSFLQKVHMVAGLTITASGEMFFVLNPADLLAAMYRTSGVEAPGVPDRMSAAIDQSGATLSILVADDSVTSRMLMQKLLTGAGYQVTTAADGMQALEKLRTLGPFDIVFSDVQMPNMDGYSLAKAIKSDPQLAHTPVVLLTALDQKRDKERGLESGADAYLLKRELAQSELVSTIEQLV